MSRWFWGAGFPEPPQELTLPVLCCRSSCGPSPVLWSHSLGSLSCQPLPAASGCCRRRHQLSQPAKHAANTAGPAAGKGQGQGTAGTVTPGTRDTWDGRQLGYMGEETAKTGDIWDSRDRGHLGQGTAGTGDSWALCGVCPELEVTPPGIMDSSPWPCTEPSAVPPCAPLGVLARLWEPQDRAQSHSYSISIPIPILIFIPIPTPMPVPSWKTSRQNSFPEGVIGQCNCPLQGSPCAWRCLKKA